MAPEPLRVALLARPGVACERLRGVLEQANASRVLEADPTALDLDALAAAAPQLVLVALEPDVEEALERFDAVLFDPDVDVIYEEADLAASREGWAVARWERHLVAKLQRHRDVLPPGREPEDDDVAALVEAPAFPGASDSAPSTVDAAPVSASPDAHPAATAPEAVDDATAEPGIESELGAVGDSVPVTDEGTPDDAVAPPHADPFDPVLAEGAVGGDPDFEELGIEFELEGVQHADELESAADTASAADTGIDAEALETGLDPLLAEAVTDYNTPADSHAPEATSGEPRPLDPDAPLAFGGFELTLDDGSSTPAPADGMDAKSRFALDLSELEQRISGLELVDDTPPAGPEAARGAVLVLAGIGGPDAVRQLLGSLPPDFPRPVLVQQRLEGARYDKLVAQMQRASAMPVQLAESGQLAAAGNVYILPADVGVVADSNGLRFGGDGLDPTTLPPSDSAVLLLSGSDPALVAGLMNRSWAGALVTGQAADGCYDAAAPNELAARGGETGSPVDLAARLVARWKT